MTPGDGGARARRALLGGNFAIGCGVMVTAGALNDLVRSLQVSVPVAGQLTTAGAIVMAVGAPLLAAVVAGWDRRRLLTLSLVWFGTGHLLSVLAPDIAWLLPLRALSVVGAAVFTPQAAAAVNVMTPPAERGRAITFIFLGWSIASVLGMPMHAFVAETLGWRAAFALVGVLSFAAAVAVWRSMPDGVKPPAMSFASWRRTLTHPLLMGIVAVTALSGSGQFTVFAYLAAYCRQVLGAGAAEVSLLFFAIGAYGVAGNVLVSRWVDRYGADRCATVALAGIVATMLLWPLATTPWALVLAVLPWGFGLFSSNSAQQVRLGAAAPELAPALMALNSSAIYVGQAVGAASGGAVIAAQGMTSLHQFAAGWVVAALALSAWLAQRMRRERLHA